MSNQTLLTPPEGFSREIRLGLVIYGGIALAIYMNGVCQEFYNAVRGRGIYKLIKALTDSDIVVDIVSGTSAGGVNGVLLSYALANSTQDEVIDFAEFAQVWRESANINKLMHYPSAGNSRMQRESILDGEGFYQEELEKAFKQAPRQTDAPKNEWLSQFRELDLFVTGTDVLGKVYNIFDDTGSVIEIKDHRGLFHLKHRQGRKEPFHPEENTFKALAKLCRITSCFPLAFPTVTVQLDNPDTKEDKLLVEWGALNNRNLPKKPPKGGYQLHFVDGGVLDNRPFTYTIKEMYYRTANRPVNRKLFYIDPSPDNSLDSLTFNNMPKPDVLQVVQESLVGLPTYESISNDLQLIREHNEKVLRYKSLLSNVEAFISLQDTLDGIDIKEDIKEDIYLRSRLISLRDRVLPLILQMEKGSLTKSGNGKQDILEDIAKILVKNLENSNQEEQKKILQYTSEQIRNLDVEYALRKHFYMAKKICQILESETTEISDYNKFQVMVDRLNRQIKLLEVIREALEELLSSSTVSKYFYKLFEQAQLDKISEANQYQLSIEIYNHLIRLHRCLLDADGFANFFPTDLRSEKSGWQQATLEKLPADFWKTLPSEANKLSTQIEDQNHSQEQEWLPQKKISSILAQLKQKIAWIEEEPSKLEAIWAEPRFQDNDNENDSETFSTILREVEKASEKLIHASGVNDSDNLLALFQNFRHLDPILYPFEFLMEFTEKEMIQTIRISPNDAQMGLGKDKGVAAKLAGDSLRAFGGFFKKSWRSNDILWGRLDGLNRIFEALLTPESLKNFSIFLKRQVGENQEEQKAYLDLLIKESLPNAKLSDREKIKAHLIRLSDPTLTLSDADLKGIIDDLVMEGHREIVNTDLVIAIEDEIYEQFEWNRQRIKPINPTQSEPEIEPKYYAVPGYFERMVTTLAAGALAKKTIADLSLPEKENLFSKQYNIGSETVFKNVPAVVLANIFTRFALIMRDVIATSLGDKSEKLRRNLIYQIWDKSLQFFYWWLQVRGPLGLESPDFSGKLPLVLIAQIVLGVIAVIGFAIAASKSFTATAVAVVCVVLYWLLGSLTKKTKKKPPSDVQ